MAHLIRDLLETRSAEKFTLHEQALNQQMVRVLKTIGFDRDYRRGVGPYLYDADDNRYLDLLSGWGALAVGRNHPTVNGALREVLDQELPNLAQMDVSVLAGVLAEQLVEIAPSPGLEKVFFANSGTEAVEAALKMARYATGRSDIVYCDHGFHGLTYGALSLNGDDNFRDGFGPLLPGCRQVPFNDLAALERALADRPAAFIVEPIQGKGVNIPDSDYLAEAKRLCEKHEVLLIADEIQTGLARTGRMWAVEHWGVEPDLVISAKALSGGQVPVGAVLARRWVFDAVFNRMDRVAVHGSTFGKNNMAMAAGLATLQVLKEEDLVKHNARLGERFQRELGAFVDRYEFVHEVRGKGLMIALEFGPPKSLKLRASWELLDRTNKSLFSQMILVPLFSSHRILAQVAGHGMHVIKLLPPYVISDADVDWTVEAFDQVIADCHKVPGAIWNFGRKLATQAVAARG